MRGVAPYRSCSTLLAGALLAYAGRHRRGAAAACSCWSASILSDGILGLGERYDKLRKAL